MYELLSNTKYFLTFTLESVMFSHLVLIIEHNYIDIKYNFLTFSQNVPNRY